MTAPLPEELTGALVVAVDDSSAAREALRYAATLAADLHRALDVVSVWNFVHGPAPEQGPDEAPTVAAWQAEAERRLTALVSDELASAGAEVRTTALHGNTVPTLLEVSRVARHLVVGSRGRGGFSGLLLGSTTQQLVQYASSPVTVVREGTT